MRTSLSFLANARYVAYLDEEAWWHPDHLSTSLRAIQNGNWSYSRRILTDPVSGRPLGLDQFESMGLEGGIHKARNLGYIDPSCLMIDKRVCETVLGLWNQATPGADRQSADFVVSRTLMQNFKGAATRRATTYTPLIQNDADGKERVHRIMETRGNQSHLGMDLTPWFGPIMPAAWTMPVRAFTKLRERRVMRFFPC